MKLSGFIALSALTLAACGGQSQTAAPTTEAPPPPAESETPEPALSPLQTAINGPWRSDEEKARDVFRNPKETLEFFDIEQDETVAEVWPGGGWYTQILAPYLKSGGGQFIAIGFDPASSDFAANAMSRFEESFVSNPDIYGEIIVTAYAADTPPFAEPDSIDTVLTFRNVHNWMASGHADKFFTDAFAALKPGGVLGVVEHRLPSNMEQDPAARSGYVHEDYVKALAEAAGFEFVDASEVNANPADTADHPFGVWTLPPSNRTTDRDGNTQEGFDPEIYQQIGESDRMTLKFVKPNAPAETAETE